MAPRKTLRPLPNEDWERIPGKWNVFESVEEEDPQNDGKEAAERSHDAIHGHVQPLFEQDGGAGHDGGGEEDIIDGGDDGCVKDVERLVQVVDLNAEADHQEDEQRPEKRVLQNGLASEKLLDADPQALGTGHGEGAHDRADQDVDQHILLPKPRSHGKDKKQAAPHNARGKHDETWRKGSTRLNVFRASGRPRSFLPGSFSLSAIASRDPTSSSWGA